MKQYEQIRRLTNPMDDNDCGVVALALICGDYDDSFTALELFGRQFRGGAYDDQIIKALDLLGYKITAKEYPRKPRRTVKKINYYGGVDTKVIYGKYTGKTIGKVYPVGTYLVFYREHVAAMVNGIVEDFTANSRHHVQSVWKIEEE